MPVWLPKGDHVELRKCDLTDRDAVLALLNEVLTECRNVVSFLNYSPVRGLDRAGGYRTCCG